MEKQQVSGYSDGPGSAHCKTVGLAYAGSNPAPATQNPRSEPLTRTCVSGSIAEKERFGRPFPVAVGQSWARSGQVSGSCGPGSRGGRPGACDRPNRSLRASFSQVTVDNTGSGRCWWVQLCLAGSSCGTDARRTGPGRVHGGFVGQPWARPRIGTRSACSMGWLAI